MSQKTELQSNNADLQTILSKVNGLPSGSALGDATAADVAQGKTFSSASGIKVSGTGKLLTDGKECEIFEAMVSMPNATTLTIPSGFPTTRQGNITFMGAFYSTNCNGHMIAYQGQCYSSLRRTKNPVGPITAVYNGSDVTLSMDYTFGESGTCYGAFIFIKEIE